MGEVKVSYGHVRSRGVNVAQNTKMVNLKRFMTGEFKTSTVTQVRTGETTELLVVMLRTLVDVVTQLTHVQTHLCRSVTPEKYKHWKLTNLTAFEFVCLGDSQAPCYTST